MLFNSPRNVSQNLNYRDFEFHTFEFFFDPLIFKSQTSLVLNMWKFRFSRFETLLTFRTLNFFKFETVSSLAFERLQRFRLVEAMEFFLSLLPFLFLHLFLLILKKNV